MHKQKPSFFLLSLALALLAAAPVALAQVAPANPVSRPMSSKPPASPLFYRQLVVFDSAVHGKLAIPAGPPDYGFAAEADVIPLVAGELAAAGKHYPIVFIPVAGGTPALAALVGLGDGRNRQVGADKQWRPASYIPAYVRRYPFHTLRAEGRDEALLGIDAAAPWLDKAATGTQPLIDAAGKPTPRMEQVIGFAKDYQRQGELTEQLVKALLDAGVLEASGLRIEPPGGGEPRQLSGFMVVSQARLQALDEAGVYRLHQSGALALAHGQLLSLSNLAALAAAAPPPAAPAAQSGTPAKPANGAAVTGPSNKKSK